MKQKADPNYKPPPSSVIDLSDDDFHSIVDAKPLMLVEFFAPWCGHCKKVLSLFFISFDIYIILLAIFFFFFFFAEETLVLMTWLFAIVNRRECLFAYYTIFCSLLQNMKLQPKNLRFMTFLLPKLMLLSKRKWQKNLESLDTLLWRYLLQFSSILTTLISLKWTYGRKHISNFFVVESFFWSLNVYVLYNK